MKTKRHRKIGEMVSPNAKIISYFSKVENGRTRGYYEVLCLSCYQKTSIRSDNIEKFVNCKCQSRKQFKESYQFTKDFYTWDDVQFLAREYKVSSSNIIAQLKKNGIPYEAKARYPGRLNPSDESKAVSLASIGFSKNAIAAKLQTDPKHLPELSVESKMDSYKKIAPIYKELRLEGFTLKEIADQNKTNVATVCQYLKKTYGETFVEQSLKARKRKQKTDSNKFLMRSDHRLSQVALRGR